MNINGGSARLSPRSYYIPDVVVIPAAYKLPFEDDPGAFNAFAQPLPLVVEVWSPTTGHYDIATKLQGYRERGDAEIWFIHPYERTLTAWRRQPDESYAEETYRGGSSQLLPSLTSSSTSTLCSTGRRAISSSLPPSGRPWRLIENERGRPVAINWLRPHPPAGLTGEFSVMLVWLVLSTPT